MNNNLIKPKAYFIDIDGTLVSGHKDRNLNLDDLQSMKRASRNGTYIILSTGRSLPDLKKIWEQIKDDTEFTAYGVVNNGSGIYNLNTNELLFEDYLDEDTYWDVFKFAKENRYAVKNSLEKVFYVSPGKLSWALKTFSKTNIVSPTFDKAIYNNEAAKKIGMITYPNKSKVKKVKAELVKKFGKKIDVAVSGPGLYIEINKKGVSKGSAIKFLSDKLGFETKETVHIGDSMNDAPGFEVAGYGVAMKNGMKELRELSDYITLDRKKAGVSNAIKSFGNI